MSDATASRRRMALALACLVALVTAGCGGSDETDSTTSASAPAPARYAGVKAYLLDHTGPLAVRTDELSQQADRYYALARDAGFDYGALVRGRRELATDAATVIEGALLGLALTGVVALVTFKLQRKLPYRRMLIATGLLLAFVLLVMVGTTARTLQGIGWLPITPIDVQLPYWAGTWLGAFPTWESLGAQVVALVIVFGSYVLAEELRVRRARRSAAREGVERGADPRAHRGAARVARVTDDVEV